jgi:uncharacterized protein (TIGR00730 family)
MTARRLCVFCGSNRGSTPAYADAARALGTAMVEHGVGLVFGGGRVGLMGVVADAVLAAGGEAIGVMPGHLIDREVGHTGLTQLVVTETMHERKARMAELADGVIVLPGGFGTFEEALEVLTWNQLGLLAAPVVFLDVDGFFAPLLGFLDRAVEHGFVRPAHRAMAQRAAEPVEALRLALAPAPTADGPADHKWIDLERA